jgi:hypothetical protein
MWVRFIFASMSRSYHMFMIVLPLMARKRLTIRPANQDTWKGGRELKYPAIPVESSNPVCSDLISGQYKRSRPVDKRSAPRSGSVDKRILLIIGMYL